MAKREDLIAKLCRKPEPKNFTTRELELLMRQCGCEKFSGGRGSGIGFVHIETKRILQFDQPHPGNELYRYQIKKIIQFLRDVGELNNKE